MRVISGSAKGRPLKAVPGIGTRPTTDKVKEAIFSMIGPYFTGGRVLDLFAGTGGLGIEALSRGMDQAVFIDADRKSIEVIRHNLQAARLHEQAEVYRNDASRALQALCKREIRFRLVFLDPPYKLKHMEEVMQFLDAHSLLEPDATIVIEHDASHQYAPSVGLLRQLRHAVYGETAITIYGYKTKEPDIDKELEEHEQHSS